MTTGPPPAGYPDGDETQVMKDAAGQPTNLTGSAIGAEIEVIVDHDEGTRSFRVNGGPLLEVPKCLPFSEESDDDELTAEELAEMKQLSGRDEEEGDEEEDEEDEMAPAPVPI